MEIDDKKCLIEGYYWTLERAKKLEQEIDTGEGIYGDVRLIEQVKLKVKKIEQLMKEVKDACEKENDLEKLENLKKTLKGIRNVNFELEIQRLKQKIALLIKAQSRVDEMSTQGYQEALEKEMQENQTLTGTYK